MCSLELYEHVELFKSLIYILKGTQVYLLKACEFKIDKSYSILLNTTEYSKNIKQELLISC